MKTPKIGNRLFMMDGGEVIFDVAHEEKAGLTKQKLLQKFHEIRHHDLESDEVLLSE